MQYSITQEASADHAAMTYLDASGQSARGLLQFFQILQGEELLSGIREDPYLRTHPLTAQRIDYVRNHVEHSRFSDAPDTQTNIDLLKRIKVKLDAFISPPSSTLGGLSREGPVGSRALCSRDRLLPDPAARQGAPDHRRTDPRLSARPVFSRAQGADAVRERPRSPKRIQPYEEAVRLAPAAPLLRISLAQAYIESNDPKLNKRAIAYLNDALRTEDKETQGWHLLATAYGRDNQIGMAALALAEEGLAAGKKKDAQQQALRAKQLLAEELRRPTYRAENIHREAEQIDESGGGLVNVH